MTAESRKAIPGRAQGEDRNLDRLVFGDRDRDAAPAPAEAPPKPPREKDIKVRFREYAANDDSDASEEDPVKVGEISFVERAAKDRRRKDDRRRGYSRLPDERGNFGSENSKRGPMLAAIAIGVVVVFGAVVWNTYRDGVKSETAVVRPKAIPGGSFKSKPEGEADAEADQPQTPPSSGLEGGPAAPLVEPSTAGSAEPPPSPAPVVKAEATPEPAAPVVAPKIEAKPAAIAPKPSPAAAEPAPKVVAAAAIAAPKAPSPAKAPVEKVAAFAPAFAVGGPYVVQLGALNTEAEAEAAWAKASRTAPELLASAEKIVVKAEVAGKTVYRVRAGAFANAGDAEAFCSAFKARGGVCFRAAR